MEFLREQPIVSLANAGKTDTFVAEIFEPRPTFEAILSYNTWSEDCRKCMNQAMQRKNSSVSWVGLFIDHRGCFMVIHFAHPIIVGSAKTAAGVLLRAIPHLPKEQQCRAENSLRPLDEVDRIRIAKWETVQSLRPATKKRKREEEDDEHIVIPAAKWKRDNPETVLNKEPLSTKRYATLEKFLEDNPSDEEEEVAAPRLMLTYEAHRQPITTCSLFEPTSVWEHLVKTEATIILAEAGTKPEQLAYIRCHREARRQLLLQGEVAEHYVNPRMPQVTKVALQLAKDEQMPGPNGGHGKRAEFLKRCAEALAVLNPKAETDIKKLSKEEEHELRIALGEKGEVYEGCLSDTCLDKPSSFTKTAFGDDASISICAHCGIFKWCSGDRGRVLSRFLARLARQDINTLFKSSESHV